MKAILEFNLPEEAEEYKIYRNASNLYCALSDYKSKLFTIVDENFNELPEAELKIYKACLELLNNNLKDYDVEFFI